MMDQRVRHAVRLRPTFLLAVALVCAHVVVLRPFDPHALAQVAPAPSKADLDAKTEGLKTALAQKRYGALAADIPPKMLALIASKAGMPVPELLKMIESQMQAVFNSASIDSFDLLPGDIKTLPNGAVYALLPNTVRMTVQNKKAVSTGHVLAIVDDGKWYLARVSEQQWHIFAEAYPAYAGIEMPKEKMEFLK